MSHAGIALKGSMFETWVFRCLLALPIASLAFNAIAWLKYGVDVPYFDDWRKYGQGNAGSFDLRYLFTPENDTLYPVGKFLDSLAFSTLGANSIPYQFLSMLAVLGGLLALQWRLLSRHARSPLIAACAFSLTLFMLQPDSYWGGPADLAYHQAIPLLCVLGALNILFASQWKKKGIALLTFLLGLAAGFTYISGAFAFLSLGLALLIIKFFIAGAKQLKVMVAGLASLASGALSVFAQMLALAEMHQQNERYDYLITYPWQADFWLYMLGKLARSILLPLEFPALSLAIISLITAILIVTSLHIIAKGSRQELIEKQLPGAEIFLCLFAVIFAYLCMVSAGRATVMRPADLNSVLGAFSWGYYRFHFFWVTLLWPWLFLLLLNHITRGRDCELAWIHNTAALSTLLIVTTYIVSTKIFSHDSFYRQTIAARLNGLECLRNNFQLGGDYYCPMLHSFPPINHAVAVENARKAGASFVRNIHYVPIALGASMPKPLYRFSEERSAVRWQNIRASGTPNKMLETAADPGLQFSVRDAEGMLDCRVLELSARFMASSADYSQLFYLLPGKSKFSETDSQMVKLIKKPGLQTVTFRITSEQGFLPKLRFDPVKAKQRLLVDDLEVRCRSNITKQTGKTLP